MVSFWALPEGVDFYDDGLTSQQPGQNLALDAYVTADNSLGEDSWYISNLTDGIRASETGSNGWSTTKGVDRAEINVDLGQTRKFNRVDLYGAGSFVDYGVELPKAFEVQISEDGISYETVAAVTEFGADGMPGSVKFDEQEARYIRACDHSLQWQQPEACGAGGLSGRRNCSGTGEPA